VHKLVNEKINKFKICKSVRHHKFQINQPTRCDNFSSLLLDVYVQLNVLRASSRPLSGAELQEQPLFLPLERGESSAVGCGQAGRTDHNQQQKRNLKEFNMTFPREASPAGLTPRCENQNLEFSCTY
jgi:hypothetical protein